MKTCKSKKRSQVKKAEKEKPSELKQFFSGRIMKQSGPDTSHKHETIDSLINALDIVNKEAVLGGIGQKSDSKTAFVRGIHSIRSAATNYQTPHSREAFSETPVLGGNRMVSNLKAELVRNNIVTRNDLMKLYQPPLKRAQIPSENPFFTKQMVD